MVVVVVYQAIIEPPQLTLFNSVLDWVVAIYWLKRNPLVYDNFLDI